MTVDQDNAQSELAKSDASGQAKDDWLKTVIFRLLLINACLSVAGIGTGLVALYAALTQAHATQAQLEASIRPELVFAQAFQPGDGAEFAFIVANNGNGPARMRAMRVTVEGTVVRTWAEMLEALDEPSDGGFGETQIAGRLVQPSETLEVFATRDTGLAQRLSQRQKTISVETCYCSLFEQCWLPPENVAELPRSVVQCPSFGEDQFLQ